MADDDGGARFDEGFEEGGVFNLLLLLLLVRSKGYFLSITLGISFWKILDIKCFFFFGIVTSTFPFSFYFLVRGRNVKY